MVHVSHVIAFVPNIFEIHSHWYLYKQHRELGMQNLCAVENPLQLKACAPCMGFLHFCGPVIL